MNPCDLWTRSESCPGLLQLSDSLGKPRADEEIPLWTPLTLSDRLGTLPIISDDFSMTCRILMGAQGRVPGGFGQSLWRASGTHSAAVDEHHTAQNAAPPGSRAEAPATKSSVGCDAEPPDNHQAPGPRRRDRSGRSRSQHRAAAHCGGAGDEFLREEGGREVRRNRADICTNTPVSRKPA